MLFWADVALLVATVRVAETDAQHRTNQSCEYTLLVACHAWLTGNGQQIANVSVLSWKHMHSYQFPQAVLSALLTEATIRG